MTNRWLGGTLTNFRTIRNRVQHMVRLETSVAAGDFEPPDEEGTARHMETRSTRLNRHFGGISDMDRLPAALS